MYLTSLKNLTPEFPREVEALSRLDSLLVQSQTDEKWFTLAKLYETANFSSQYVFNYVLNKLIEDGDLEKVVRVETNLGGIDDFSDIEDVPEVIFDWRVGENIRVKPEFVKILFKREMKR